MPDGNIMQYIQNNEGANRLMLVQIHQNQWWYTADHICNSLQRPVMASRIFMG